MLLCAGPYPLEFRDGVVRVAQNREDGVSLEQIAADFGIHPMTPEEVDAKGRRGGRDQARRHVGRVA